MKTPKNVAHIALWLALTATICVPGVILVRSQRKYATCYTLSLRPSRPHCTFAIRVHGLFSDLISLFLTFGSCLCTMTKMNSSHTCLRSWWRSHCVFYSIKARCKANQGLWERNRIAMSYLQRQTLTLVLNRFKTNAEGWRSGERVQSLWQCEGNFLSVLRTNQKRMEATLGPRTFPLDRNVKQLYAHCARNTSLYPFHCGIIALPLPRDRNVQQL